METERKAKNPRSSASPKNPELLVRMVMREGKTFQESALAAGYGQSTSKKGLNYLARVSSAVSEAIERESAQLSASLANSDRLKPMAVKRLLAEITDLRRPAGIKAIELLGRFKETDWWIRNVDVQIGIFQSLAETSDPASNALDSYDNPETK